MEKVVGSKKRLVFWLTLLVLTILIYIVWVTTRALPSIQPIKASLNISSVTPSGILAWPNYGQSAVGLNDYGVLATNGQQHSVPMASTAKLITALCVLAKKPLALNQQGPTIPLNQSDVQLYDQYLAENGSVMLVNNGEQISEYQMLEGMLLPSGDNVADSLAIWAFGSLANYQSYANQYLKSVSLDQTTVGSDASGFAPSSETSASNLVSIGELVAKNPVISQIVAEPSAGSIPVVGTIHNVNYLLGTKHIDGIKTGNTDQAGGVFLSSSKIMLNNQPTTVFTAIMGARTLWDALNSSSYLVVSAQNNFSLAPSFKDVKAGSIVGGYIIPWSKQRIDAISSGSVAGLSWGGTKVNGTVNLKTISFNYKSGQQVGNIYTQDKLSNHQTNTPVIIKQTIPKPSKWWLVFHPAYVI